MLRLAIISSLAGIVTSLSCALPAAASASRTAATATLSTPVSATPAPVQTLPPMGNESVRATLANGMQVVVLPNKLAPVATTVMLYAVGSDDDTMPGIAHATEHMMFRGTSDISAGQLADIAARMGAVYDAQTSNEFTAYWFKLPSAYVDVALRIEADRMTNATIAQSDWATERGAIEQEIRAQESQPGFAIAQKLRSAFFSGTPLAKTVGGTVDSFEKMKAADIKAFYQTWYRPSSATLVVSGDVDPTATIARAHALFDPIPAGTATARTPMQIAPLPATTIRDTMDFPIGFGAYAYRLPGSMASDHAAALVLDAVLDSGRGDFADLQAQNKVLAALSFASAFPEVGVTFLVAIPAQGGSPEDALALVSGVIDGYRKDGVPPDLVYAAKTRLLAQRAFAETSISGLGFAWADSLAQRETDPDAVFNAIANVTPSDVDRVIQTYFVPEHQVSVIIAGKQSATIARPDPNAGVENVSYTPNRDEPLPSWAAVALKASLRPPSEDAGVVTRVLPNGLRLKVRRETTAPAVIVSGLIRNDPHLYEPKGKDGVSTIVADLLPWGTQTYDRKGYQTQLDAIAASVSLGTAFDLEVESQYFDRGIALLADGMLHPAFDTASFSVVKSENLESVKVEDALPSEKADNAQRLALYPAGDPRRRQADAATIGAITLDDAKKYYRFAYRPDLTEIAIVGDISPDDAQRVALKYFGEWKGIGRAPSFRYPEITSAGPKTKSITVKSSANAQSQVTLKEALRLYGDDEVALELANTILSGEGTGSVLFQDLRTRRGYVYNVASDLDVQPEGAEFTISFASDPKNVDRAEAAALAIIRRMQQQPLPTVELQRAKASLLAKKVLPLDSYEGVAGELLGGVADGKAEAVSDREFWRSLLATTPAELEHAMRRIDTGKFVRVIVAPSS